MSTAGALAILYEKQSDADGTNRSCGAACLSMVYRSLGKEVGQAQIWPAIAKPNRFGSLASTTHLMARDAISQGLAAVAIQAKHPLLALRLCRDSGFGAILNHRLRHDAPTGHYTVLVDVDDKTVVLHDPYLGPARRLSHAELLELWQPRFPNAEIVGNVLIGIAALAPGASSCQLCRTPIPSHVQCPRCHEPVRLHPAALLACVSATCIARMWNYLCCPSCDYTWSFGVEASLANAVGVPNGASGQGRSSPPEQHLPPAPITEIDQGKLDQVFNALEKFSSYVLTLPAAAAHPEIKKHLAFLASGKEQLKLALAEDLANQGARQEQLTKLQQAANGRDEAYRKRVEDLNRPLLPLDGNSLGRALLKNVGLAE